MSVSKVHDLLQNKGCVWFISILMVLGVVFGSFSQCSRGQAMNDMTGVGQATPVAFIGDTPITERVVSQQIENATRQYSGMELPPNFQLQTESSAMNSLVGSTFLLELAKKYGVEPSDEDILVVMEGALKDELDQLKQQLISQGKLKANSTEAEFAAEFKKADGRELSEAKEQALDRNKALLKEKDFRVPLAASAATTQLLAAIKKTLTITDDEIKKSYDSYDFKKITIMKGDVEATAKKALAEIKGGLSFEAAIDRYSNDTPEQAKKLRDTTSKMQRSMMEGFDPYKPLMNLKPGEVSEVVKTGSVATIYKLISLKSELPKDFDKNKDTYKDSVLTSKAAAKLQAELLELQKTGKIDWKSDVYRLIYEYGQMGRDSSPQAEKDAKLKKIMEDAIKASNTDNPFGSREAHLIAFVVFTELFDKAPVAEKDKMLDQKIEVYRGYLQDHEDTTLRLDLVEIFLKKKNAPELVTELMSAANNNMASLDASGQSVYNRINKYVSEAKTAKLLTDAEAKQIQDLQQDWKTQKTAQEKVEEEARKQEEAARKEAEAADKAAKAKAAGSVKTREELEKEKAAGGKK